jgi:hypothetical protein
MSNPATLSKPQGHKSLVIPLLGALSACGPLSIDMYLPSLPTLAAEFGATPGQVTDHGVCWVSLVSPSILFC